jgi:N-acetylglucosaminyl-diphospho-decaprenol L-rhamnosyltransferase
VSHRSAAESAGCVASLRSAFEREAIEGEIVLVDCGSGPEEVARLAALGADVFLPLPENRGYSGGLNAGLARARGERLVLANADIVFCPGALTALLGELEDPAVGAAAPLAVWEADARLFLPPGDRPGFLSELARLLAGRSPALDRQRFSAFARECVRLWTRGGRAKHLVGAVLAARRDVFDRAGRFDERFPFEYEETEWEERVLRAGLELRFVPGALVRHRWASSASRNPDVSAMREASRRLYRERRWGRLGRRALEKAGAAGPRRRALSAASPLVAARPGAWLGLSPNASGIPFAGFELSTEFRVPRAIHTAVPGDWYLWVFRGGDGRVLETARLEAP